MVKPPGKERMEGRRKEEVGKGLERTRERKLAPHRHLLDSQCIARLQGYQHQTNHV